jgi:hypothetical protein
MKRRDTDQVIHAFVLESRDQLPERTYAAIRREIDQMPQRIVIGPWRTPLMNDLSRYAVAGAAVAAVAVAAVIGINFISRPAPTPAPAAPTSSPSATPAPIPTPISLGVTDRGHVLEAGTYSVTIPSRATYTLTVPAGWTFDDVGSGHVSLYRATGDSQPWTSYITVDSVKSVYPNPCDVAAGSTPVDQSVDEITTALTHLSNYTASTPTDVHLAGANGKTVTIDQVPTAGADGGACTGVDVALWRDSSDFDVLSGSSHQRLWILDVARGNPIVAEVMGYPWTTAQDQQAAEDIVSTMTIEPAN